MSARLTGLAAVFALLGAAPGLAEAIEEKNLVSGKDKLDAAQGYIFVQAPFRTQGVFLRVPDDATRAEYQKDWDEGFAKAEKKYASALKNWESSVKLAKEGRGKVPPKPEAPNRETFSVGPIETRDMVAFGPMFVFGKSETQFSYLSAVKPGTYVYYGPLFYAPGVPVGGSCYCMGTVQFDVKPGAITDLGNALLAMPVPAVPYSVSTQKLMEMNAERKAKGKEPLFAPPALAHGVPDSLKALPAVKAELRAHGKLNNYFGIAIDRMAPIPGVLDYRRDSVIDLRTGQAVANPPIRTLVRIRK